MKTFLLAITAALAVVAGVVYFKNDVSSESSRLLTKSSPISKAWTSWKQSHGVSFGTDSEDAYRQTVFETNFNYVHTTNNKQTSYSVSLNKFAAMTNDEFKAQKANLKPRSNMTVQKFTMLNEDVPSSVDWRGKLATPVKDQGQCGSCWAFSTVGSIEGAYAKANGEIQSFAEQQLVDCSTSYGNNGCGGGLMDYGFQYAVDHGLVHEADYAYTARDGTCKTNEGVYKISGFSDVGQSDSQLAAAVANAPVSVAIDANTLQFYTSGVYDDWSCGHSLDHGVLAVGYTSDSFIVKNSWGQSWGEEGFFRFARRSSGTGMCGITMQASFATN